MNYHGENWEIGDTLVHLEVPSFRAILLGHNRSESWPLPENMHNQVAYPGRWHVEAGYVLLRALVPINGHPPGRLVQELPKYLTKLLPPAIETQIKQEKPVENEGEEEFLRAA